MLTFLLEHSLCAQSFLHKYADVYKRRLIVYQT